MAIVTWGLLGKSAIDPKKIEERIIELIAEHNDNEAAHIGTGRSLDLHKVSETIDHLVASIVEDKIADWNVTPSKLGFYIFTSFFESLDGYEKTAGVTLDPGIGHVELATTNVLNNAQSCNKKTNFWFSDWDWDHERHFETVIALSSVADVLVYYGGGAPFGLSTHIGFYILNNELYGYWGYSSGEHTVLLQTISANTAYHLFFRFLPAEKIEFYVNDILKQTVTTNLPHGPADASTLFVSYIRTLAAAVKKLYYSMLDVRQKI